MSRRSSSVSDKNGVIELARSLNKWLGDNIHRRNLSTLKKPELT